MNVAVHPLVEIFEISMKMRSGGLIFGGGGAQLIFSFKSACRRVQKQVIGISEVPNSEVQNLFSFFPNRFQHF